MYHDDKLREECAVVGIGSHDEAAKLSILGLHALQHRGQEAAGLVVRNGKKFIAERGQGLVSEVFKDSRSLESLSGNSAIAHSRYSTSGESSLRNVQPLYADLGFSGVAIAHNGNLTNALSLRETLVKQGAIFATTSDTEVILHLMARAQGSAEDRLISALKQTKGGYALVCLSDDSLMCVRDPNGIRPMVLGKLNDTHVVASETVALDIMGATYIREIEAGELVVIKANGYLESYHLFKDARARPCIFEYVYFARPDSIIGKCSVYETRKNIGEQLAHESYVEADVVVPVPDSGTPAALGYARKSNQAFELGIIRSHYVGRSFIEPTQDGRSRAVMLKHNANRCVVDGKRVVLIDDSLVRGTTAIQIVKMVRDAGAIEVHMRIASPPVCYPCFYGIDMPRQSDLLAHNRDISQMQAYLGVDSLAFISIDGLYRALGEEKGRNNDDPQYSDHYFTGDYPVALESKDSCDTLLTLLEENNIHV